MMDLKAINEIFNNEVKQPFKNTHLFDFEI